MLATSKNVLFPGYNHLLTTGTDDPLLTGARAISRMSGHQYRWLAGGYDLEIGLFRSGYLVDSIFFCAVLLHACIVLCIIHVSTNVMSTLTIRIFEHTFLLLALYPGIVLSRLLHAYSILYLTLLDEIFRGLYEIISSTLGILATVTNIALQRHDCKRNKIFMYK